MSPCMLRLCKYIDKIIQQQRNQLKNDGHENSERKKTIFSIARATYATNESKKKRFRSVSEQNFTFSVRTQKYPQQKFFRFRLIQRAREHSPFKRPSTA